MTMPPHPKTPEALSALPVFDRATDVVQGHYFTPDMPMAWEDGDGLWRLKLSTTGWRKSRF